MGFSFFKKKKINALDSIETIIKDVENTPFGISEENVLYAGLNELGGYYFFQTVVVGKLKVKTIDGATLIMKGVDTELEIKSDTPEFESDPSNIPSRHITKIDFQIEESDIEILKNSRITSIQLKTKKQDILFTKHDGVGDEEEE
ncbi:MAG: hypothetical protein HKP48_01740 [Winogradskyella sp.]|uniref:hypothetical protein n=1 Tax=Winogradskyella sp. TaxID=1883156 RepID=UPI0017EC53D0|nr:hypothetical protein [Winogradskyella sp.]MBT8243768.1 hypothetical protein [Winogradskyella sp.]NNK22040.1 hypothetical protein [Winogradskyella sp.]